MNNTPRYPQRVRNDLRFRELTVLRVERISAGFQRIVLGGEALDGFTSRGFDDHSKLFFPQPDAHFVPPTVYRALDFLLEQGFVHKVESTNSYVLCHLFDQPTHTSAMFICDRCGAVKEECAEGVEDI
eukprot:97934_1